MSFQEFLEKLGENPPEKSLEVVRILLKIADAIISNPKNINVRILQKSNPTISKKILEVDGGAIGLRLMGFDENSTNFTLPIESRLNDLHDVRDILLMWKESVEVSQTNAGASTSTSKETPNKRPSIDLSKNKAWKGSKSALRPPVVKPVPLPPLKSLFMKNAFLHQIEISFHKCLQYEDKNLQARAKAVIPVNELEVAAQRRLRIVQEHIKRSMIRFLSATERNRLPDPNLSIQDLLVLELLQWFKEDFFTWVDSPGCNYCGGKTRFSHYTNDSRLLVYTNRVELHRCEFCHQFTPFPRYNDLNILLETRKGRCGEWANTFTLLCRAMGWDARFVMDETDHVWSEVYSLTQERWLHCDPCENVCDIPLLYESGWKKTVSYVIAYSGEEVQDVTWRYTSNHKEVLKRRKHCREQELIDALLVLRKNRQQQLSECRRNYLTKRIAIELAELMIERKPSDAENIGRQSGDSTWRLARGEIQEEPVSTAYGWCIKTNEMVRNVAIIRYSTSDDIYEFLFGQQVYETVRKWQSGTFSHKNVFRKEEKDWKQVYLARKENIDEGEISWKFEIDGNSKTLDEIRINFKCTTYENGNVTAQLCSDNVCETIPSDSKLFTTKSFFGKRSIILKATLSGGMGDVAWQHAQLFRQSVGNADYPFTITFIFK